MPSTLEAQSYLTMYAYGNHIWISNVEEDLSMINCGCGDNLWAKMLNKCKWLTTNCSKIGICRVSGRDTRIELWGFENNCSFMQLGKG